MTIKEIRSNVFDAYASKHIMKSLYQTSSYGRIKDKNGYNPMYIGAYEKDELIGAALVLTKKILPTIRYGYAPRGFLLDYYNVDQLKEFTEKVKAFFFKRNYAFIKINPEIIYSVVNLKEKTKTINNNNERLSNIMISLGYQRLKSNLYFEAMLPRYNPIINLSTFDMENVNKSVRDRITNNIKNGLILTKASEDKLPQFYEFIKGKRNKSLDYYQNYYKEFKGFDSIDLILVEIQYTAYIKALQSEYSLELDENAYVNKRFVDEPGDANLYQRKMDSDKRIANIKKEIDTATYKINTIGEAETFVLAGALVVKSGTRANIIISGFDKNFPDLQGKYFLYYKIIEEYQKEGFKFLDLGGMTGDFSDNNPYRRLNDFKLAFNPTIYEYIGEFDLVINNTLYEILWKTGKLDKEFGNGIEENNK